MQFTSKGRDAGTGLDYFGARYYASTQGRFTSPDDFLNDTHVGMVAFGNVDAGTTIADATGKVIRTEYKVQIDFKDFERAGGDEKAKEAYSVGLVAIHEFDHKLYNVSDYPNSKTDPGPLETNYTNPIRQQLNLPERVHYVSEPVPAAFKNAYPGGGNQIRFQQGGKEKVLRWRNDVVGGKVVN